MLSVSDQRTFGADTRLHRITGRPLEQGSGALEADAQAIGHWGQMQYELAELTQQRKDHADKLASGQDFTNLEKQGAALKARHEELAVEIAEIGAKLKEEGIFDRYGMSAAASWFGMIRDKGWSI